MSSLLSLFQHYSKAGAVLDKSENQADVMRSKMEKLYAEIEVMQCMHVYAMYPARCGCCHDCGLVVCLYQWRIDFCHVQGIAREQAHIKAKIDYITETGVDDFMELQHSKQGSAAVIDITEAQEREAERRRRNLSSADVSNVLRVRQGYI